MTTPEQIPTTSCGTVEYRDPRHGTERFGWGVSWADATLSLDVFDLAPLDDDQPPTLLERCDVGGWLGVVPFGTVVLPDDLHRAVSTAAVGMISTIAVEVTA